MAELESGHLAMLFRMDGFGRLQRSDSYDFGETWGEPFATDIPNPSNKPQLLKTNDGRIVLLNTPNDGKGLEARVSFGNMDFGEQHGGLE